MKIRIYLSITALLGGIVFAAEKPNVIVILTDDMGYGDIAAHGNPILRTPHLDKLHAESARLIDFHVDPTCSPTRAALLTGKYSHRAKVWHTIAGGNHLRASELTMADVFRANGYRTGMFGKWHLGSNFPYRPMDRGFDEWLGQGDGGNGSTDDHFLNDRVNDHYLHNGEWEKIDGFSADVFFKATIGFARESKKTKKPFFAYLATYEAHAPHTLPDPALADEYGKKVDKKTAFFLTTIGKIDTQIGKLREALAAEMLDRDTILIFLTDNGGTSGTQVFNAGMRGKKGSVHDGGHRVPCFIHWPAGGLKHGQDIVSLNAHIDLLPTLTELCELKLPREVDFDGRSFRSQLLESDRETPERTLFIECQRTFQPRKWQATVGMTSRWRLVDNEELYDIKRDPGQKTNVFAQHSDVVEKIRKDFDTYWSKVTPGDRDRAEFIVGDVRDKETFLHASDWYLPSVPWNHAMVASGGAFKGDWFIRAARPGTYRFEVRRWPREADAPLSGIPEINKSIDAWDAKGGKKDLIYGSHKTQFKKLPVATVRLRVGETVLEKSVDEDAKAIVFEMPVPAASTCVMGEFLDASGKFITSSYYIYCDKIE